MSKRIDGLTFVRVICTLGIIAYHASSMFASGSSDGFFDELVQHSWGNILVTAFFALSGVGIYLNNHSGFSALKFYKKRISNIFISFWLVWGFMYLVSAILSKSIFYAGKPFSIMLSIMALDGYVGGAYYFIGEWFLGALVILYLLYPALNVFILKAKWKTSILIGLCYLICIKMPNYDLGFHNIITCLVSFWTGMLIGSYIETLKENWIVLLFVVDLFWHLYTSKFQLHPTTWSVAIGLSFFIITLIVGEFVVPKSKILLRIVNFIGGISYQMFLLHHLILNKLSGIMSKYGWYGNLRATQRILGFIGVVLFIILCSFALKVINDKMVWGFRRLSGKQTKLF